MDICRVGLSQARGVDVEYARSDTGGNVWSGRCFACSNWYAEKSAPLDAEEWIGMVVQADSRAT